MAQCLCSFTFAENMVDLMPRERLKLGMLVLIALLLLCHRVGNVQCATVHDNRADLSSLLHFKQGIIDPNGALKTWNTSTHYCSWTGVMCTQTRPWRVSGLNLTGRSLGGQISSYLGNLTYLSNLDLSNNSFVGSLPFLNQLQQLQLLNLGSNILDGAIPDELTNSSSLKRLDLSANLLVGAIPLNISLLSNLEFLILYKNNLTGNIPQTLGDITSLKGIYLAANKLSGSIPDKIWQLPNLLELVLGQNSLSGGIPHALRNLSSLETLTLELNMLGKSLPPNMGDALSNLQLLYLANNMFEGQIPASLGNASGLQQISLLANNFVGKIPASLGKLSDLSYLDLGTNRLEASDSDSWEFLHALGNCRSLEFFSVSQNQLEGHIPNSIGSLSPNVQQLVFSGNKLSGIVPPSIGNLQSLTWLGLDLNNLTGPIDEWIGKLTKLVRLNLRENNFIGPIPSSIGNLNELAKLNLAKNEFTGLIPPSFGNLQPLTDLNLSYNNLQGNIPIEFGKLEQLVDLDLSSNNLTGFIPDTLGKCENLGTIKMEQNNLNGNIPTSFGYLKKLTVLNLSHNSLSGNIPASLNDLLILTTLDLSYNHLEGEIPRKGVFENASALSLGENSGLCGGAAELHMPSCQTSSKKTKWRYYLIRVLIPMFGFLSIAMLVYFLFLEKNTFTGKYLSSTPFGEQFLKVSYTDLAQATRNFSESNLIGRGIHGSVYRGRLKDTKMEVAVKVFDLEMGGAERSFMAECEALRSIQHRNILPIITACSTVETNGNVFKALVYEFMPNGNLDIWLHRKADGKTSKKLGLTERISIAVNIADALDYLHHDCGSPTVHRDLKPSNILLDDNMNALIGDFGIARLCIESEQKTGLVSSIGGTIGYIAPEYAGGGHASISGDVYSFGVILLEMLTGKRPTDPMFGNGLDIMKFVETNLPRQILHVVDASLIDELEEFAKAKPESENMVHQCLVSLLQLGLLCTRPVPSERMNMKQIASKLHDFRASYIELKASNLQ
uniref:Receptor kinase-like protein Xa21 n=2 Tax=Oryza punctata TaxID=4537 RepID=A0A0E0K2E9_ORYPU